MSENAELAAKRAQRATELGGLTLQPYNCPHNGPQQGSAQDSLCTLVGTNVCSAKTYVLCPCPSCMGLQIIPSSSLRKFPKIHYFTTDCVLKTIIFTVLSV